MSRPVLHFEEVCEENIRKFAEKYPDVRDLLSDFSGAEDDAFFFTVACGCLVVRVFSYGRVSFLFPLELAGDADVFTAVEEVRRYATLEEVPLVFLDVPPERLGDLLCGFRHADVDAETPDASSYRVRIKTECELLDEFPEIAFGTVLLDALTDADAGSYGRLCRDETVNRLFGYDYREDYPDATDVTFLTLAREEFSHGSALVFAVREKTGGEFLGEATLYAFDGRGGAFFAVRLLPEWQRRGFAADAVSAMAEFAASLGMHELTGECRAENLPSVALFSKFGTPEEEGDLCRVKIAL